MVAATSKLGAKAKAPTRKGSVKPEELQIGRPMGLGALVDWIAFRGGRVSARKYDERMADATDALIKALREHESITRRSEVIGVPAVHIERPREPIPLHLWGQTCSDVEKAAADHLYVLILLDDKDGEYGGTLETLSDLKVWTCLQLDPRFVLDRWKPGTRELDPRKQDKRKQDKPPTPSRQCSVPDLKDLIIGIRAQWPYPEHPLSQKDVLEIVNSEMSGATRAKVREFYRTIEPPKQGPKGKAGFDRVEKLKEFKDLWKSAKNA